jgi:hypothetical protein
MGWNTIDLPGAKIETVDDARVFGLGETCKARNTTTGYLGEFVYMQGVASNVVGAWVLLNYTDNVVSLLVDTDVGGVAVAMSVCEASEFGWFQIRGQAEAWLAASCADNAELYTTSTAGVVDDATSGEFQIWGARCAETVTSSAIGEVELHYPQVAGPDAS